MELDTSRLATLDHDYRAHQNPYMGDEKLPVQFYMGIMPDDSATEKEGRPIYKELECIKIFNSKDNIIDREVRESDKRRWPQAYAAWKSTGESVPGASGTRLEYWPVLNKAQVAEFQYFKVFTVEQLAELPDSLAHQFMGFSIFRDKARKYIEVSRAEAPLLKLQNELAERDATISAQGEQLKALTARLDAFAAAQESAKVSVVPRDAVGGVDTTAVKPRK